MLESISFINCSYLHNVVLIWSEIVHIFHSVPVLDQTDFEHPIFSIISSQSRTIEMDPTQKMLLLLGQERNVIYSHPVNNPRKYFHEAAFVCVLVWHRWWCQVVLDRFRWGVVEDIINLKNYITPGQIHWKRKVLYEQRLLLYCLGTRENIF